MACALCAAMLLCSCGNNTSEESEADGRVAGSVCDLVAEAGDVSFKLPLALSEMPESMMLKNERTRDGKKTAECFINDAFFGYVTISDDRITAFDEDVVLAGCAQGDFSFGKMMYGAKRSEIEDEYGAAVLYSYQTSEEAYYFDDGRVILLYAGEKLMHLSVEYSG